jgi:REP-associated tyrosine transposase
MGRHVCCCWHGVHKPRPVRLPGFSYIGAGRYHVRTSTARQHPAFTNAETVAAASSLLLQLAEERRFAVLAYCFMPDHVHVLLDARDNNAALRDLVKRWKQASGYWYMRRYGRTLWQSGYFERILRREDTTEVVANYIMANPVRAGLAKEVGAYPYAWVASEAQ